MNVEAEFDEEDRAALARVLPAQYFYILEIDDLPTANTLLLHLEASTEIAVSSIWNSFMLLAEVQDIIQQGASWHERERNEYKAP